MTSLANVKQNVCLSPKTNKFNYEEINMCKDTKLKVKAAVRQEAETVSK